MRKKPPLARRRKARQLILQALYQWLLTGSELTDISKQFHEQNQGKIDWEFFDEVLPGVLKSVETLDKHLHPLLDRKLEALDPIEKALLYLGT